MCWVPQVMEHTHILLPEEFKLRCKNFLANQGEQTLKVVTQKR
jgi:hypothetical protein